MKLRRRWGWIRRALAVLSATAFVYFVVLVVLALLQADFDRRTFTSGTEESVNLTAGETREVYLTAEESHPLNFDFYPSDLTCEMEAPGGEMIEGRVPADERRLLDGWRMHWGVESFTAPAAGTYVLLCMDMSDRSYPLVLARASRYGRYSVSPSFGLFVLGVALVMLAAALLVGRARDRRRPRPTDS